MKVLPQHRAKTDEAVDYQQLSTIGLEHGLCLPGGG